MTVSIKVGAHQLNKAIIAAEFLKMRIKHPRLEEAHETYHTMRQIRKLAPHDPPRFSSIFAPTHSGKSMTITTYIEKHVVPEAIERGLFDPREEPRVIAQRQNIVLHVTLSQNANPASLATDILTALGDDRATKGEQRDRMKRAYDLLRQQGTELVVIDEIQHLAGKSQRGKDERNGNSATDALKAMLIRGLVPMVFIGVVEARAFIVADSQLAGRTFEELDFSALSYAIPHEREMFVNYLGLIGHKLKQHNIFDRAVHLVDDATAHCVHAVASGRLGIVSRLLEQATIRAVRSGDQTVNASHLSLATIEWAIPLGIIDYNPFVSGVRPANVKAM